MTADIPNYDKWEENYEREHNIFCPFCGTKQNDVTMSEHTTFHGEKDDEDEICYCDFCNEKFIVEETVDRTFETKKCD